MERDCGAPTVIVLELPVGAFLPDLNKPKRFQDCGDRGGLALIKQQCSDLAKVGLKLVKSFRLAVRSRKSRNLSHIQASVRTFSTMGVNVRMIALLFLKA